MCCTAALARCTTPCAWKPGTPYRRWKSYCRIACRSENPRYDHTDMQRGPACHQVIEYSDDWCEI
ncbi:hypothetical protein C8Q76DRAFT_736868 [Earliella scabrosa]|nr:hypothetical protein C8Q76DRAFT_736868 [Earliella scabrosa]